ncbi:MAG: aspartate aminotransferase family protein [Spirochaetia bacterium]|nr:aspartate aminotransferase family protein [Spirochaetia bacterium]
MSEIQLSSKIESIKEKTNKFVLGTYNRFDIAFEYGVGELLFDVNGKQYIDFQSGIAVTNLGHSEADIIDTLREQADKLFHTSNLFYSSEQADLAEVLIGNSFPGKVFFCNSGTEANEAAIKIARRHAVSKSIKDPVILTMKGSFHGRTTGAMSMTGQYKIREGFGDLLPGFDYIEENNVSHLTEMFSKYKGRVSAVITEPVLGEYGVLPLNDEFLIQLRKLTAESGALLVFDEIQTGIGRTGKLFCFQHFPFTPDVVTLAKALGSGFPVGAVIVGEKHTHLLQAGMHGSTFGGNHLACKVAYETLRVILTRDLVSQVPSLSEFFFRRLRLIQSNFPELITEIRGKGLHIGVVLSIPSREIVKECLQNGLILNSTNEKVVRIMPPINISIERIEEAMTIFEGVLSGVKV